MPYDPSKLLVFCHVPHTGGTSVYTVLAQIIPPRPLAPHRHYLRSNGHGIEVEHPETDQYVIWLRQPMNRFASQYQHWKNRGVSGNPAILKHEGRLLDPRDSSIDEYAEWAAPRRATNFLGMIPLGDYPERITEFMFVGILERMQDCLNALANIVGSEPIEAPHLNRSVWSEEMSETSSELIAQATSLEASIHQRAIEHWSPLWDAAAKCRRSHA